MMEIPDPATKVNVSVELSATTFDCSATVIVLNESETAPETMLFSTVAGIVQNTVLPPSGKFTRLLLFEELRTVSLDRYSAVLSVE